MAAISITLNGAHAQLLCAPALRTADAAQMWESAQSLLAAPLDTLTVDASAVEQADTAALQVLAVLVRDLRMAGCTVHWKNGSAAWIGAAELAGLHDLLHGFPD